MPVHGIIEPKGFDHRHVGGGAVAHLGGDAHAARRHGDH